MIVLLGGGLSACADSGGLRMPATEPAVYPSAVFAHRVGTSHVVLYWNCVSPEAGILLVEGVVQQAGSMQDVRFLELDLAGADARDRYVSSATAALPEILLRTNAISPFQLDLRTTGVEVRFDLFYQYRFQDNDGRFLPASSAAAPRLLAQTQRFMARDVCFETQHRVR